MTFARQANVSPESVAALLITARDKGLVDGRSISTAASLIGHDNDGWNAADKFAQGLTNDQTEQLVEQVLRRLETPHICDDCVISRGGLLPGSVGLETPRAPFESRGCPRSRLPNFGSWPRSCEVAIRGCAQDHGGPRAPVSSL